MWIDEIKEGDIVLDIDSGIYYLINEIENTKEYSHILRTKTLNTKNDIYYDFFYLNGKWWHENHMNTFQHKFEFFKNYGMCESRNEKIDKLVF